MEKQTVFDISVVPPLLTRNCELEEQIWGACEEKREEIKLFLGQLSDEMKEYAISVIIGSSTYHRFRFRLLSDLFSALLPTNIALENTRFTEYLYKRGIVGEENIVLPVDTQYTAEELEECFDRQSVEFAVVNDDYDRVVFLSAEEALMERKFSYKGASFGLLEICANHGSPRIFNYLVINGCKILGEVVQAAVAGGNINIIQLIKGHNVSFDNCLEKSIQNHHTSITRWLLEEYKCEAVSLKQCLEWNNTLAFCYMIEKGANIFENNEAVSLANIVASNYNLTVLQYLVSCGVNLTECGAGGLSALHLASSKGALCVIEYLLKQGVPVEIKQNNGMTPLSYAAENGQTATLLFLVEHGATGNAQDEVAKTPLIYAVLSGRLPAVKVLLDHGFPFDSGNSHGWTPIMYAASSGNIEMTKFFVELGAKTKAASVVAPIPEIRHLLQSKSKKKRR